MRLEHPPLSADVSWIAYHLRISTRRRASFSVLRANLEPLRGFDRSAIRNFLRSYECPLGYLDFGGAQRFATIALGLPEVTVAARHSVLELNADQLGQGRLHCQFCGVCLSSSQCSHCREDGLSAYRTQRPRPVVDHVWPRVLGGSSAPSNLAVLCDLCNRAKSDLTDWSELVATGLGSVSGLAPSSSGVERPYVRVAVGLLHSQPCRACKLGPGYAPLRIDATAESWRTAVVHVSCG